MRFFFDGEISLFVSEAILREVRDVLGRDELRRKLPAINDRVVNALVLKLEARAVITTNVPEEYHYDRDPNDEKYLNLAIVSNASYLVSKDDDLLDLISTNTDVALRFRTRYPFLADSYRKRFHYEDEVDQRLIPYADRRARLIKQAAPLTSSSFRDSTRKPDSRTNCDSSAGLLRLRGSRTPRLRQPACVSASRQRTH